MENIVDITLDLIKKSKDHSASTKDIIKNIKNNSLLNLKPEALEATVLTDLSIDGRFLQVEHKWCLKDAYTVDEIIHEQYRSIGDYEIMTEEELDLSEEESDQAIEMAVNLDGSDQLEADDAVSINDIEEYHE